VQQPPEQLQVMAVARPDLAPRPQADCRIDRLRAVMKQIERPDVERAASEIDSSRSGGLNLHPHIIAEGGLLTADY
jgi:hypothetical protein